MLNFKQIFVVLLLIFCSSAWSKEEAPPVVTEQEEIAFSGRQDEAWIKMQADLGIIKSKLDAEQNAVNELLVSRKTNKKSFTKEQLDLLNESHKKLIETTKNYNKKLNEFELRYPEKGRALGRQYIRKKALSLDEMESSLTLDGRIRKINKKIKSQYNITEKTEETEKKVPKTEAENKSEPQKTKPKGDVTEKIILVK